MPKKVVKHTICVRLERIARAMGYSNNALSKLSGVHATTIGKIFSDGKWATRCPNFETVEKLLIGLDQGEISVCEQRQRDASVVPFKRRATSGLVVRRRRL